MKKSMHTARCGSGVSRFRNCRQTLRGNAMKEGGVIAMRSEEVFRDRVLAWSLAFKSEFWILSVTSQRRILSWGHTVLNLYF